MRIALWGVGVVLVAACAALAWATFPGTPAGASSLKFEGFVSLPKGKGAKALTVLDYVTVSGDDMFVANVSTGTVYRIALRDRTVPDASDIRAFDVEPAAHGVAVDPVTHLAYVSRSESNTVDVFDPSGMRLVKRIAVADDADAIFYLPPFKLVYVANGDAKLATLIDPARQAVVGTIALGAKPEFAAFDRRTQLLYQNLEDTSEVAAVSVARRAVLHRWPLMQCDSPTGMALNPADDLLFIGCSGNSRLVAFDLKTHHVIDSVAIGGGPDSVAFDPDLRRVYAAGRSGVLSVVRLGVGNRLEVADTISLHYGAHTLAIDPATHRVYVAYASLFVAPRLAVFSAVQPSR